MSVHVFHEIFLHITWHNNHDSQITPTVEKILYEEILHKCHQTDGIYVHGLGGTETHIHLAISIDPTITIGEFVGVVKGASSHEVNSRFDDHPIKWKRGYGVVSFNKRYLKWVQQYIENQKEHHQKGTISLSLEKTDEDEV